MNVSHQHRRRTRVASRKLSRRGTTLLELLAAFSLLITVLGVSAPLVVRHGRLLKSADEYRLALDELTNQLERLRAMPGDDIEQKLKGLKTGELTAQRLLGAKLEGALEPSDGGTRVRLKMTWDEPKLRETPVELVGWLPSNETTAAPAERSQP
jgi:hypothetical protein